MNIKKSLDKALEGVPVPEGAYLPPVVMGTKVATSWERLSNFSMPTIEQQRIRIQAECDPIGQLMAIANGLPIASFKVVENPETKELETKIQFETANLATRIKLLEAMRDKLVANAGVNPPKPPKAGEDDDNGWGDLTRRRSAQILEG